MAETAALREALADLRQRIKDATHEAAGRHKHLVTEPCSMCNAITLVLPIVDAATEAVREPDYEARVTQVAAALHRECELEWQAIALVDPTRALTMHMPDAHYERAHTVVRALFPGLG